MIPHWAPTRDRNNDFLYKEDDPAGFKTPGGSHIRRTNPRDASVAGVPRIHRMIRRGTAYGPLLPEGVLEDDGADRGLMFAFVGAHLGRQFEFVQSQWINDGVFLARATPRIPSSGRTVRATALRFHGGRFAGACRASHGLSSRGAVNMAFCPDCEPCAGSPTFKHRRRVAHVRRHRHWRRAGGCARRAPRRRPGRQDSAHHPSTSLAAWRPMTDPFRCGHWPMRPG